MEEAGSRDFETVEQEEMLVFPCTGAKELSGLEILLGRRWLSLISLVVGSRQLCSASSDMDGAVHQPESPAMQKPPEAHGGKWEG